MATAVVDRAPAGLEAFTVDHFRDWAAELELDSGDSWIVEPWFELYLQDYFAGVPECWAIVPEGNAKTTSLAGLALYLLEFRPAASIPWAASSRDQAEIGYRQAEGFVLRSPRLRSFLKCQEGYRRIKNTLTGGRIQIFAADDKTGDGVIPTDAFLDELHRQRDMRLYRTWRGKLEKRGGQLGTISTAGEPGSEFEQTRDRIRSTVAVLERRGGFIRCRSDRVAFHEYAVGPDADVSDMAVVKEANPFQGLSEEMLQLKFESPTMTLAHWRRFVCNIATRSDLAAIAEPEWSAARVDDSIPAGEPVDLGLDLGWKYDTTALVPLWIRDPDYRLLGPATILEPPRNGDQLDAHAVEAALLELHARNPIRLVVMDMTNGAALSQWIQETIGADVVDRSQGKTMQAMDYARFMEALREGWLHHTGDPGLTSHVLNAIAKILPGGDACFARPAESRTVGHELARRRVIDALTAAAMVHCVAAAELTGGVFAATW